MNSCGLAVEIGGTKLQIALGSLDGRILRLKRGAAPVDRGAAGVLDWIERETRTLLADGEREGPRPTVVVVGFGGPVETATGRVLTSHQVAGWEGMELKAWFEERFGLPTVVANDSNAAGWGEYKLGAGQGTRHFAYMNIGSGIGGALIIDGRLHDGQGLGAGELGHTWIADWTADKPGVIEKLENLCSGWSIEKRLSKWPKFRETEKITCQELGARANAGDQRALAEIDAVARGLAQALANLIALVHPERIAIGGGVSLLGDTLLNPLRRHTAQLAFGPYRDRYQIVPCQLGETVVLSGALLLAAESI